MFNFWKNSLRERKEKNKDIAPDEIFLDASNLPNFNTYQFEGRIEKPVSRWSFNGVSVFFVVVILITLGRLWSLQVVEGDRYFTVSESNRLDHEIIFAHRGVIFDRSGKQLAWNEPIPKDYYKDISTTTSHQQPSALRKYYDAPGLAHVLGYVSYPKVDGNGYYFQEETEGSDGVELYYNDLLSGENGRRLKEINALGEEQPQTLVYEAMDGGRLNLTIDVELQTQMHKQMVELAEDVGFAGGAAVLLDIANGEVRALTSVPEYNSSVMTEGLETDLISSFVSRTDNPFLNRTISGLYTPGSVIKPFIALGALGHDVISPETEIYSSGALEVPNPYDSDNPTVFKDWKAHGWVDLRDALAVSSNVYFFEVGGGSPDGGEKRVPRGLGIAGINEYADLFGIGEETGIDLVGEVVGTVPSLKWKEENFPSDPWRVGDTYNTSIGQYGFQVTPLQMARSIGAIANGGFLVEPHVRLDEKVAPRENLRIDDSDLQIVREGMRQAVLEGTAKGLNMTNVAIAAKTGTAELGQAKTNVNSWAVGFFPYEKPRYAFAIVMENGPATNLIGSLFVMRRTLEWMTQNAPEYFDD